MTNAEKFIEHYIAIEKMLRRNYGSKGQHQSFLQLVAKAEKRQSVVAFYADDLREYGELRNAIVHNRSPKENDIIAEPHSYVVERMAYIRNQIEHPVRIEHVMNTNIMTAKVTDTTLPIAQVMLKHVYTHVPVYDGKKFVGVLSETALLRIVGERIANDELINKDATIQKSVQHLDESGNIYNDFEFAPRKMFVMDARARFEQALDEGRRLGAIFVTKTGKNDEKIEGLVTAWDLPKLRLK